MIYKNQSVFPASAGHGLKKKVGLGITVALLGMSQQALAHIEYYDLNQGKQISDLTAAGKTLSTAQYSANPTVAGLPSLNTTSDRPLNDPSQWNAANQVYTGVGSFSGVTYTPTSSTATVNVNDVTDKGWGAGTQPTLGDSHQVDFFNFRLAQTSTVTLTFNVNDGAGDWIDNGFTLYKGVASYQAHDDSSDPMNPTAISTGKYQDPLDTGTVADAQGIASAYRNTLTNTATYAGQFNALQNWGDGNAAGNWSNLGFIAAVHTAVNAGGFSANAADTLEKLVITLAAGNYTVAASGALGALAGAGGAAEAASFGLSNLNGTLTYSAVAAVPLPGAVWLFMTAMIGMLGLNRRKSHAL